MGPLNRLGLLAGLAMGFAGMAVARADPPAARIAIGDLTFNYMRAAWLIVPDGDGLVATCLQDDCRGAVIDINRREGEADCTEEAMTAAAERLFPTLGRDYANTFRADRFALVLAERHDGPDLTSPAFVHGCVAWQGSEYRFAMRPETVGKQSRIGGALHYLVSQATAPAAVVERVRLGEVDFRISTEAWTISYITPGEAVWLTCRMPACQEPGGVAALSVRSPDKPCSAPAEDDEFGTETKFGTLIKEAPDGLDFTMSTTYLGCRNYVPPRVEACAVHNGRSYRLSTFGAQGCRSSGWGIAEVALTDLLRGARVAN